MSELTALLRRQIVGDLRALPERARRAAGAQRRLARMRTIADLRAAARRALPRAVFDFVDGAAGDELALRRNRAAFEELALRPRFLVDVSAVDTRTSVLGSEVPSPLLCAPTGLSGLVHPGGEAALARAAQRDGSPYVLSGMASYSIEEVAEAAPGPRWLQLYVWKDRGFVRDLLARAHRAGYGALVVTVDAPRSGSRERDVRNGFSLPPRVTLRSLLDGALRPRWAVGFARHSRFVLANTPPRPPGDRGDDPLALVEYFASQFDPAVTWDDLARLRDEWPGPLAVKGLLRADDARRAVEVGAQAVWVSNHGGRQLDDAPAALDALPAIADAVGDRAEVYFDSGIRRGGDVVKALALGARACFVGRPPLYGLAVAGEEGAFHALTLLRREVELTLALAGCASIADLDSAALLGAQAGKRATGPMRAEPPLSGGRPRDAALDPRVQS